MTETLTDRCARCDRPIELRPVSSREQTYRWFSSVKADSWHCGNDPLYPTLAHSPQRVILPSNAEELRPHEFESHRDTAEGGIGLCAACGLSRRSRLHR